MVADETLRAIRSTFISFTDDPFRSGDDAVRIIEDGVALVRDGRVAALDAAANLLGDLPAGTSVVDCRGCITVAGFVDAHVHYPQTEIIASPARDLLEWLEVHTFPAEIRFADPEHARAGAEFFLDQLLAAGTTSALVFCATAPASAEALFTAAAARNLRLIAGKTMMDRNAPEALCDTVESSEADARELLQKWHGHGRLGYAITPRFAITSTPEQLAAAGRLAREFPEAYVHSHISESAAEIAKVQELFPEASDYTDVYDRFGLLRKRSVYAHGIHLSESELSRFHAAGASIVHCPSANNFLGSGLMDLARTLRSDRPVPVGLGSDVGGGTSLSMLRNLAEAYNVAQLCGTTLQPYQLLYLATWGSARALDIGDQVGNLAVGMEADFVVLDPNAVGMLAHRAQRARHLADTWFAMAILGDERVVRQTWVNGAPVFQSEG